MGYVEPKVSVVIPAYNRAAVLIRVINSVLTQTFADYEILVIDDASTDNTSEVIKTFTDERIVYLRHSANKGGAAARNTGIERSRGELIAFLDSDDQWSPDKLKKQVELFERADQNCGVIYTALKVIYETDGTSEILPAEHRGSFMNELLIANYVRTLSSAVVRRKYLDVIGGFDPELKSCQDWDLYLRLMKHCTFECINEPLTIYYVNKQDPSRISNARRSIIQGHEAIARKFEGDYKKLSNSERVRYCESMGEMYILGGNLSHSFGLMMEAFRLTGHPRYLLKSLHYAGRKPTGINRNHL
jgi:glycosyltransferase involved in cell wall biosynthesis